MYFSKREVDQMFIIEKRSLEIVEVAWRVNKVVSSGDRLSTVMAEA